MGNQLFQLAFAERLAEALTASAVASFAAERTSSDSSPSHGITPLPRYRVVAVGSPDVALVSGLRAHGYLYADADPYDASDSSTSPLNRGAKKPVKIRSRCLSEVGADDGSASSNYRGPRFWLSDKPAYATSARKTGFPPFAAQIAALARRDAKGQQQPAVVGLKAAGDTWIGAWAVTNDGGRRDEMPVPYFPLWRPPRCVVTEGYFQEMGYYAAPGLPPSHETPENPRGSSSHVSQRQRGGVGKTPDGNGISTFPRVPRIVRAVAPPAVHDNINGSTARHRVTAVHIRRCEIGEKRKAGPGKGGKGGGGEYGKFLASSFYPALPLGYYLAAIGSSQAMCSSAAELPRGFFPRGKLVVVAPENCRKSAVVKGIAASFGISTMLGQSSGRSSIEVDFGRLRAAGSGGSRLVLSVGTFSWWAAWLASGDHPTSPVGEPISPSSIHVPHAGCQRRFRPFVLFGGHDARTAARATVSTYSPRRNPRSTGEIGAAKDGEKGVIWCANSH